MAVHTHTFNIVPVSVISHVPPKYNLHNIFITCILNYGSPWAQDIKRASDCLLLDLDGAEGESFIVMLNLAFIRPL